jgi:hypothetical protein
VPSYRMDSLTPRSTSVASACPPARIVHDRPAAYSSVRALHAAMRVATPSLDRACALAKLGEISNDRGTAPNEEASPEPSATRYHPSHKACRLYPLNPRCKARCLRWCRAGSDASDSAAMPDRAGRPVQVWTFARCGSVLFVMLHGGRS